MQYSNQEGRSCQPHSLDPTWFENIPPGMYPGRKYFINILWKRRCRWCASSSVKQLPRDKSHKNANFLCRVVLKTIVNNKNIENNRKIICINNEPIKSTWSSSLKYLIKALFVNLFKKKFFCKGTFTRDLFA